MRTWSKAFVGGLCFVGALSGAVGHAGGAKTLDSLSKEGTKLATTCREPAFGWQLQELLRNFKPCNGALQAFVQAIEASKKDPKAIKATSSALTKVDVKLVPTALYLGLIYKKRGDRRSALRYFKLACLSASLPYIDGEFDPRGLLMAHGTAAEAELDDKKQCEPKAP